MKGQMISIEADVKEAQKALSGTSKSLKSISRKVVSVAARGTVKTIKGAIRANTQRRTGELLKAYRYKVEKDGSAIIFPKGADGSHLILAKASVLTHGATITPRKGRGWLQVKGNGYFARPKEVTIRPRGFVQAGERYAKNGEYMNDLQKVVDKELAKYWGN